MSDPEGPRLHSTQTTPYRHQKAAEVIANELRRSIISTGRTGDFLVAERVLIEQFGVSRPTLREALRILESDGLLEIRRGIRGGAVVREPSLEDLARRFGVLLHMRRTTLDDVFLARKLIEPAATRLAAERVAETGDAGSLHELLAAEADVIKEMETDERLGMTLVEFHDGILELAGSETLTVLWRLIDRVVGPYTQASVRSFPTRRARVEAVKRSHEVHVRLTKAITAGEADLAEQLMRRHLAAVQTATGLPDDRRLVDVYAGNGSYPPRSPLLIGDSREPGQPPQNEASGDRTVI